MFERVQLKTSCQAETEGQLLYKRKNTGWRAGTEARDSPTGRVCDAQGPGPRPHSQTVTGQTHSRPI